MLISMLLMSSMLINMLISMLLLSSLHCDSYIKASVVPQAQRMSGHHRVNIKMFQCPDCGKEFTRKFNMERHRIVSHGDSNSEADSEESFDHGTEASDERDSSDEQESIADEGDKGDDDDSDGDEDEDEDDNSSSDSQNSTDDEDDDDSVWSGIRDLSWTSKLLSTFNEAKKEFQNEGMTVDEAHQEAYQHVLPKLRRNIMSNYVRKIVDAAKLHKDPVHKKIMSTKRKLQEDDDYEAQEAIKYAVKKRKISHSRGHRYPEWWWTWGWRRRKWINLHQSLNQTWDSGLGLHTGYLLHDAKMSIKWERVNQKWERMSQKWERVSKKWERVSKSGRGDQKWW